MRYFDPFRELDTLRREVDRLFHDYTGGRTNTRRTNGWPFASNVYPLINLFENEDSLTIEVLAPGVSPDSIDLTVIGNQLSIKGEKKRDEEVKADKYHRSERGSGQFHRTVDLPIEVDPEKVSAEYKNGIVTLTLAKAETAKPRRIAVSVN